MTPPVLYFAPGSGVGHLTRALGICLDLRELGIEAGIAANSPFAQSLAPLARLAITHIAASDWTTAAPRLLAERAPRLAIVDTFPNGMRGEWATRPATPLVYIARRLRLDAYAAPPDAWSGFALTIAIESLSPEHDALLRAPILRLPGLVRLRASLIESPAPRELERMLADGAPLAVHGGPREEVEQLIALAGPQCAAIAPWPHLSVPSFDYFPAAKLFPGARRIFTGAGYNSIADTIEHRACHTAVAFPRRYDDQAARLASLLPSSRDSTRAAAEAIAGLLRG